MDNTSSLPMLPGKLQCSDPSLYCTLIHRYHWTTGKQSSYLLLRDIFFSPLQLGLASLTKLTEVNTVNTQISSRHFAL